MAEHQINKQVVVPYTALQMYALVNDVVTYPDFLQGCTHAVVLSEAPAERLVQLDFMFSGFPLSFATRNRLTEGARIDMTLEEGPFTHLSGYWEFADMLAGSATVQSTMALHLCFMWAPGPWSFLFRSVLHKMSDHLVEAFCSRADRLYSGSALDQE